MWEYLGRATKEETDSKEERINYSIYIAAMKYKRISFWDNGNYKDEELVPEQQYQW